ncbi:MAG: HlyD family secretion protein [Cytophagales bacterium]
MLNLSDKNTKVEIQEDRLYSIKLVNSSKNSQLIVSWLSGIFIALFLSLFLPWQQNIEGSGAVTAFSPRERPQTIQTLIAGRIEKWYVQEGQHVDLGDTIARISEIKEKFMDPQLIGRLKDQVNAKESSINSKKQKVQALENQIRAIRQSLGFSISKAKNKLQQAGLYITIDSATLISATMDKEITYKQLERQQKLFEQGLVSLTNLEQRNLKYQESNAKYIASFNKYNATKNDMLNAEIELNSVLAEYTDKISKAESDKNNTEADAFESQAMLAKLRIELSNMEIRNNYYIIRAPQDGNIIRASKQGIGETVKEGEEVCTIMPSNSELAVELYIKPMDLPLVYIGCPVRIQFDGWPAVVFAGWPGASVGTFGGKIKVIDRVNSNNGKYRVLITRDNSDKPWPSQVRMGSGVLGWTMLNNVVLGYEIWRQFNGFPPDFSKTNNVYTKKKKKFETKKEDDGDD